MSCPPYPQLTLGAQVAPWGGPSLPGGGKWVPERKEGRKEGGRESKQKIKGRWQGDPGGGGGAGGGVAALITDLVEECA